MFKLVSTIIFFLAYFPFMNAQGLLEQESNLPSCGSYKFMEHIDQKAEGFLNASDNFVLNIKKVIKKKKAQKSQNDIYRIPVVFHIVHNVDEENMPDSVITNQLEVLNECFRRTNANASDTREEFLPYVGDAKIEFYLAESDPEGLSTNGITRTETAVEYFGGVLPYNASQTTEIQEWVADDFYANVFRLTATAQGGIDPWDTERFLNIWVGDLRIFEPEVNNFEELFFVGLATPPIDHYNWPGDIVEPFSSYSRGVILHYVSLGANNPVSYPSPYQALNTSVSSGKIAVHEVGHYLALRHIWGDGDCTADDFIDDTPLKNAPGVFNCNQFGNSCTDDINEEDLPDMVENYMDYTSGECQNSFTLGQIEVMKEVVQTYYPDLADVVVSVNEESFDEFLTIYPNPATKLLQIELTNIALENSSKLTITDAAGRLILDRTISDSSNDRYKTTIDISSLDPGYYLLHLSTGDFKVTKKWMKL